MELPLFHANLQVTRENFPNARELQLIFQQEQFNQLLSIVKTAMIHAKNMNLNQARIMNNDMINLPVPIIRDVKDFLREKNYKITEIEDVGGISTGWKINIA